MPQTGSSPDATFQKALSRSSRTRFNKGEEATFGSETEGSGTDDGKEARLGSGTEETGSNADDAEARLGSETEEKGTNADDEEPRLGSETEEEAIFSKTGGAGLDSDDKDSLRSGKSPTTFFMPLTSMTL